MALVGALIALAFFGAAGPLGDWTLEGLRLVVGVWVYVTPVVLLALGGYLVVSRHHDGFRRILVGVLLWFVGSLALFHLLTGGVSLAGNIDGVKQSGGALGSLVAYPLNRLLGFAGASLVICVLLAAGVMLVVRATVRDVVVAAAESLTHLGRVLKARLNAPPVRRRRPSSGGRKARATGARPRPARTRKTPQRPPPRSSRPKEPVDPPPQGDGARRSREKRQARPSPPPTVENKVPHLRVVPTPDTTPGSSGTSDYQLPPIDLLKTGGREGQSRRMLEETARQLEETLHHHDVNAHLTNIVPGPTVTRYEIELAPGVKVARVTNLAGDIAYALATPDVRLLAPIPGRSAIGVEVPNRVRRLVTLGDVLSSDEASRRSRPLVVGLGEDISGQPVLLDLAELPHVLIAGATGAGKSSCINSIVTSLLARAEPDDVRLIMVDPKRVELGQYNGVPHLLTRVITKPKKAVDALQWAVAEMDRRYDLLAEAGVRDISGYQAAFDSGRLGDGSFDRFPYLVVLIDELNDLMMVAGRDVESAVVRIAQMARAVGIHLVIATQRPSVNVITGVIKANVPSRLAFSVASQTDSRVIIDTVGAEKLVGMGDMLVVTAREPRAKRVQGAWVSEAEIAAVVEWVKDQKAADYRRIAEEVAVERRAAAEADDGEDADLVRRATDLVVRSQLGSTSMLQRKLRIGFARAGRIMDILEQRGIVGPSEGSKAREVLMTVDELESPVGAPV
ncbi:MAG: DNA translocase FtsK 4TM domain-containing protein [bacterium]|nr:DNA translocase FtsK 4TM domain-containing protein [bacterium]